MAGRDHARVLTRIWRDRSWKSLSGDAQRMYLLLLSQPILNYAGVQPLHERMWAKLCADSSTDEVTAALKELSAARFVVMDEDTEEILVRSFIRNDGLWKQPKILNLALEDARAVESAAIRLALAAELRRLPVDDLDRTRAEIADLLKGVPEELEEGLGPSPDTPSGGGVLPPPHALPTPSDGGPGGDAGGRAEGSRAYAGAAPGSYSPSNTTTEESREREPEDDSETGQLISLPVQSPPTPKPATKKVRAAPKRPTDPAADAIAEAWWERFKTTTGQSYMAIRTQVRNVAANGTPHEVIAAAVTLLGERGQPISGGWLTTALAEAARSSRSTTPIADIPNEEYLNGKHFA